jgi:hypothetical protein
VAFLSVFTQTFLHYETYYYENCRGQGAGQMAKAGAAELRERRSLFTFYIKKNLK